MNIAFSKIGKSIKFVTKFSPIGGDNEPGQLLRLLANNNPNSTFYITGKSDFKKLSKEECAQLFFYNNVIDVWANFKAKNKIDNVTHVYDYFKRNDVKIDFHIAMIGQIGTVTIPNKIKQIKNQNLIASVIDMTLGYSSPIIYWMNEVKPKTIEIINDPRYDLGQSRDIIVNPTVSLSQFNDSYIKNTIRSYADQTRDEHVIKYTYAEMEKIFLYGRTPTTIVPTERSIPFMIILNEGTPSRYEMLKEWVLNKVDDVEIYGQWEHESAVSDPRFKGSEQMDVLQKKLQNVRASFIIPIAPGWVTSKYIELIFAGVVPLLHPSYDTQGHLDLPELCRPKTPDQMLKIVELLKNDNFYTEVITRLQNKFLSVEYFNGSKLSSIIMRAANPGYITPDLSNFKKVEVEHITSIEDFF